MITITELYKYFKRNPVISTDTRNIEKGSIFFSLRGDNFNGNLFANEAINNGASIAIVDEEKHENKRNNIFYVPSSLKMLQNLASYHRDRYKIPVLAITGTNGKTTTKELISSVLKTKFNVTATKGNLNNHIGVPITLLRITNKTEFAIIEMGANHIGEIKELCEIAKPNYGIITNIGIAHLEGFGSFEGVIETKSELYRHLQANEGTIFVNSSDNLLIKLSKDNKHVILYGEGATISAKIEEIDPTLKLSIIYNQNDNNSLISIQTNLAGKYNLDNILVAFLTGIHFNVDYQSIKTAIEDYKPLNIRSQIKVTKNNKLIIDAYNANPSSMQKALENFAEIKDNDKTLILGDMFELGSYSKSEHSKIVKLIIEYGFTRTILIGFEYGKTMYRKDIITLNTVSDLISYLQEHPLKNKTILLKGSRGIGLEKVIDYL